MNQKFKKFSKIKNDDNSSIMTGVHDFINRNNDIDNQLIKQILLKHKKGVFSILIPIYKVKYDIDNYNINDRFNFEYNSIL